MDFKVLMILKSYQGVNCFIYSLIIKLNRFQVLKEAKLTFSGNAASIFGENC